MADNVGASRGGGNVWVIDTATNEVTTSISVGSDVPGSGMAIAPFPCGQPPTSVRDCNGDSQVTVNEIITAVNHALNGC